MKIKVTIDADGKLVDGKGRTLGRIVTLEGLTLELDISSLGGGGGHGKPFPPSPNADPSFSASGTTPQSHLDFNDARVTKPDEVQLVWEHYQRTVAGAKRYKLEEKRRQIIRNALKVRTLSECLAAIDGLAASPHHNGQNDRRTKYLGIQYALKGFGAEGTDERIDKMGAKAGNTVAGVLANVPSAGREMVRTRQRQVEDMLLHPGDLNREKRAEGAADYLRETFGLRAYVDGGGVVQWVREAGK